MSLYTELTQDIIVHMIQEEKKKNHIEDNVMVPWFQKRRIEQRLYVVRLLFFLSVGTMWVNKERPTCNSKCLNKKDVPKLHQALETHTKVWSRTQMWSSVWIWILVPHWMKCTGTQGIPVEQLWCHEEYRIQHTLPFHCDADCCRRWQQTFACN